MEINQVARRSCTYPFLAAGLYAGNVAYEELFSAPWDQILGIENRKGELDRIHSLEARNGWQRVEVHSRMGRNLSGRIFRENQEPGIR